MKQMFDTVLIANRGEIALRVMRACKELGLRTIAVYSEADRDAPHVAYADAAYLIGPPPASQSYLDGDRIIAAARTAGAGAIHPGCGDAGLIFVGPPPSAMERMGGKVAARREATAAGVPLVPGTLEPIGTADQVRALGEEYGYPLVIKAVGGGGGRGMRVVAAPADVEAAFESARREAESSFKDPQVYVEKYFDDPRHIEIQILADSYGHVIHLGERDCSIQRRHQKLIEECPSPALTTELRAEMGAAAAALTRAVGYVGAGTLEFLFQGSRFYFLEMNTRIQVEHTVTEMVTGVDLVQAQLRIARGEPLWIAQEQVGWRGHAIECRINAEDPAASFRPALGTISDYVEPSGFGVRVDSGARPGYTIPQYYDSLIAKLVVWGSDRAAAIERMRRALADYQIGGVQTTIAFHQLAIANPAFARGEATVNFIPRHLNADLQALQSQSQAGALAAPAGSQELLNAEAARIFHVEVNGRRFSVRVAEQGNGEQASGQAMPRSATVGRRLPARQGARLTAPANGVVSSLQGTVVAVRAAPGQSVVAGQVLFIVEAMKMENEIVAPHEGTLGEVRVQVGQVVEAGMVLATYG
jgi:acetyl-CoA/propionyl-CoA carboxylase, biotin carboxylase, biotin carboxyl carrier protein